MLTYLRRTEDEEVLVAINLSSRPFFGWSRRQAVNGYVDVTPDVGPTVAAGCTRAGTDRKKAQVGLPALSLDAWGYRMFRRPLK